MAAASAWAHKPSDSYLTINAQATGTTATEAQLISGQWDIALRDLDFAIGLDADGDGAITWGELRARHADIAAFATARLVVRADGQPCQLQVGAQQVDSHTDGAYTVLPLQLACAQAGPLSALELEYRLFADIDPQHRGLLNLRTAQGTRTAVLGPQASVQQFLLSGAEAGSGWRAFVDYVREGVWHIWIGFDHILFLLALLFPAVGFFVDRRWRPADRLGQAAWEVLRVVTAFTVAHSITLSLATLGWVSLPSRLVESAIAASVVLAALNNVWPLFHGRRWWVAFVFGLIHGFGFASVLADLGLPQGVLALALLGFNIGVELGQLAIVAAFLPLAFALRSTQLYRKGVLVLGSLLIALLASVWLAERVLDLSLMPF
ncbi:MAG: HupE/UreJ family protein [Rubrivivax sp.]|nr:HupE/UreJ family protein [Rubrivivax sp.]MDP3612738.1 HupE/UreJ family protein [Rubrivivax sp.]